MNGSLLADGFILRLPTVEITLKKIDFNETAVGFANTTSMNFNEVEKVLNILVGAVKELAENIDINSITDASINKIESGKKVFKLRYNLDASNYDTVTHYNDVYKILRVDELTYIVSRELGDHTEEWDTSNIMCQVKDMDGVISNVFISTTDNSIVVVFENAPEIDFTLFII